MQSLIEKFDLKPHPEGGYYREVYRGKLQIDSPVTGDPRQTLTHIYFLLTAGDVSRFHRVLHDEVWNHYAGAPLRLIDLHEGKVKEILLGPQQSEFTHVIRGGHYQAAESQGDYSLLGCTVAPGFDFADFNFIEPGSDLARFIREKQADLRKFL
ncbi:cupin domain-containing protein [Bowmanella dokdonensis]|uniref:Cupin domain-containing protein n=1 Tax=Bowmanella dokdonensis TaxID=751969 RepID=A0A939IN48_9ALTE|nr:cupin domain-containing protein [Bowmanella dokdonensis]MBN7825988.1 cupin domain-containing protein [Bowmanella dokdonensis]